MKEEEKDFPTSVRLSPGDLKILKETVDMGRARSQSEALRKALWMLDESNRFTRKIQKAKAHT
jgi:Arc/MetJ-type ribon-helix-helix transcriptional regulator